MISLPRNSLSAISHTVALKSALHLEHHFVILFDVSDEDPQLHSVVIRNTVGSACKFIIISGYYGGIFKDNLLDYLADRDDLLIPFFVYDTLEEAIAPFLFGELPIDQDYDCVFMSLSNCEAAIQSGRMIFNAASG